MKNAEDMRLLRIARSIRADIESVSGIDGADVPADEHDIDISCHYDTYASQIEYDETFSLLAREYGDDSILAYEFNQDDYAKEDIFEITDYDEFADEFGYDYDYRYYIGEMDTGELAELILSAVPLNELSGIFLEDFEGKNDLADWIEERSEDEDDDGGGAYSWLLDLLPEPAEKAITDKAKSMTDMPEWKDLWIAMANDNGGIKLKDGWSMFHSRGYSKGDYCTVVGKSEYIDNPGTQTAIEHMLWDAPVYCRVEVDGEEYFIDEEMNDRYDYDKDEAIEILKRQMGDKWDDEIEEYINENMPENPEYN